MADRNISRRRNAVWRQIDPKDVSPQQESPPKTLIQSSHQLDEDVENLDLGNSSVLRPGLSTRDSGYNTDLSPATTASPAANTLSQQHFTYAELSHSDISESKSRASPHHPNLPSPHPTQINTKADNQVASERNAGSSAQISQSTRPLAFQREIAYPVTHVSSPSCSESSDTNRVQFDFESDNEDTDEDAQRNCVIKSKLSTSMPNSGHRFDLSGNLINLHVEEFDEDEEDSIFYNVSDNFSPSYRRRRRSQSMRQRRYCSEDNCDDDSVGGGARGGDDPRKSALYFHDDHLRDQTSFLELSHLHGRDENKPSRGNSIEGNRPESNDGVLFVESDSSLTGSQGFKPGYFDSDPRESDSSSGFSCHPDNGEAKEDKHTNSRESSAVTILRDKPTQRTSGSRQRRHSATSNALVTHECLPLWCTSLAGVSVSTQTPHVTSVMIQQILHAPVPLPNEARGTAASRLHRLSESGVPLPPGPTPLPDIIISVGRDRSQSVPNLQTMVSRHRAREVGRELRRLSDEFNYRRNLTPVNEEFDGHPASYPRMHTTYLRNTINHFGALLRDTFRGRHNSSN